MTNILKEYQEIEKPSLNMGIRDTYVLLDVGVGEQDKRYISADELYIRQNDSATKRVSNVAELNKMLQEGKLYWSKTNQPINSSKNADMPAFFKQNFAMPQQYITDTYQGETNVLQGLSRVLEVKRNNDFSGEYVYCKLKGEGSMKFYAKHDIGYIENGAFVSLAGMTKAQVEAILENKPLYIESENKQVEEIFTDASCEFGKVLKTESIDVAGLKKTTFEYNKKGEVVEREQPIDSRYNEQVFRKENNEAFLDTYSYVVSQTSQAKYIKVKYENETVESLVEIGAVHTVNSVGTVGGVIPSETFRTDNRFNLVGKKVAIKLKGDNGQEVVRVTEPLTLDQVAFCYERMKHMNETTSKQDVLADDTYIQLADGRFMKEKAAAHPVCYDFVLDNSDDFDAYYVEVGTGDDKKMLVVSKEEFNKHASIAWKYDSMIIDKNKAFKIKRSTKEMKHADVIQTTKTGSAIEECSSLADPSYVGGRVVLDRLINVQEHCDYWQENFERQYKSGKYKLDEVLDEDGNWVKLDDKGKRYKYQDHKPMHDYSNDRPEYEYFKQCNFEYDGDKLVAAKPFDAKKANKDAYKKLRNEAATLLTFAFSGAGIIAFPVTFGIFLYLPIKALYIPLKNWNAQRKNNSVNRVYDKKLKIQREQVKNNIEEEFSFIFDNTVRASKDNKLSKNKMLQRFEDLEQMIYSLAESKLFADFRMVKGKGVVNESNAELFSKYRKDMLQLEKEIKNLKKKVKRNPRLASELAMKESLHAEKIRNYVSQGVIEPKDTKFKDYVERSHVMKGYLLERFYGEELSEQEKAQLDDMYQVFVKKGDAVADAYAARAIASDPDRIRALKALADKCRELGRTTHYDYDNNLMQHQGYSTNGLDEHKAYAEREVNKTAEKYKGVEKEVAHAKEEEAKAQEEVIQLPAADPEVLKQIQRKRAQEAKLKALRERDERLKNEVGEVIHLPGKTEDVKNNQNNIPVEKSEKPKRQPKAYNTKVVSEDSLVKLLKARSESKKRQHLIDYIIEKSGVDISDQDIQATVDRITEKHKIDKDATTGSSRLKNQNIAKILELGQEYLTEYAKKMKELKNAPEELTVDTIL